MAGRPNSPALPGFSPGGNSNSVAVPHGDEDPDADADADPHGHTDADDHTDADGDTDADDYSNSNSHPDFPVPKLGTNCGKKGGSGAELCAVTRG